MKKLRYKGENRYKEILSAAKIITGKISKINGAIGILGVGGLGRGYCDNYSDLDLIVFVDDKKIKEIEKYIAIGWLRYKEIELDTPVESYQKALKQKSPSKYWSQRKRWDMENFQILFDTNNKIKDLLKKKLVFPDWEQKELLEKYRKEIDEQLNYNFRVWEKRGDLVNVANSLIKTAEAIVLWIYAKNKKFKPYIPKWLFYYLENKLIPEAKYFNIIKKPYLTPIKTIKQAKRIREDLLRLSKKIGIKFHYESLEELFERNRKNWKKASEKTKNYLSW